MVNRGTQPHELAIVELTPDTSMGVMATGLEAGSVRRFPGRPVGVMTGLAPGREGVVTVDLSPGRYGVMCFLADPLDGAPHIAKGMAMELRIEPSSAGKELRPH